VDSLNCIPYLQGRRHKFKDGRVNALEGGGGVNAVQALKFEKSRVHNPPPPAAMVAPLLHNYIPG